jgi:hypothetical protein
MRFAIALLAAAGLQAAGPFQFREIAPGGLELSENGKPVYVYNYAMRLANGAPESKLRSSYLHPVFAPNGVTLTDDFPKDHWHHRGIFWAWPIVRYDGKQYDQWMALNPQTRFVRCIDTETEAKSATLAVENGWFLGETKIVKETIRIVTHPTQAGSRQMDFAITLEAVDQPVEISGAPENQKGYGGFSVRFAKREQTVITTDKGREEKDTDMVPHPWAQLAAVYDGKPAALRIDIDAANPGAPNGWCLRNYGFLGVNFPGRQAFQLTRGWPLSLKYRVTVIGRE